MKRIAATGAAAGVMAVGLMASPASADKVVRTTLYYDSLVQCQADWHSLYLNGWDVVQDCTRLRDNGSGGSQYYKIVQPGIW